MTRAIPTVRFAVFLLALAMGASVWAQTGTTSLRGTVLDKSGAAIVGAKVQLVSPAQALEREIKTNETGAYEFVALPPGTYALRVEMAGFRTYEQKNLQLLVNVPASANITMEIGIATEVVEVSAQAAVLNTSDASIGLAFDENQIKSLPLEAGNVPELLSLQAC